MKRVRLLGVALLFGARCRALFTCDGNATVLDALEVRVKQEANILLYMDYT